MLIKVFGAAVQGIDATLITIEVNSSRGCMFYLVGLPDSAVKESHQRIISALQVNGYKMPTTNIVVNMAPADIRKEGSAYDLPLAIGLLGANETISSEKFSRYLLMGELSLDGSIQPIKGALPIAIKASGIQLVIADSFARIFYRNSIDIGLPIIECPEAAEAIQAGDEVEIDFDTGIITDKTQNRQFKGQAFPPFMQKIIAAGGLINYINED